MKNSLLKQIIAGFKNKNENDERLNSETNKVFSVGMVSLIGLLALYCLIYKMLDDVFNYKLPFSLTGQLMFICGTVCFVCDLILCKRCAITAKTTSGIVFIGITFPAYLLSGIPSVIFKEYEKITSWIELLLIPIIILILYFILNTIYVKSLKVFENSLSDEEVLAEQD